jgi:hypothetical protein
MRRLKYQLKTRLPVQVKNVTMEDKFKLMSFKQKLHFFFKEYAIFIIIMFFVAYIILFILIFYAIYLETTNQELLIKIEELKKLCDEFAELTRQSQEKHNNELEKLKDQITKSYGAALIPKYRCVNDYQYPRFHKNFGTIKIPDELSYEKSPPKLRLYFHLKNLELNQYDSTMDQRMNNKHQVRVPRRIFYVDEIPENYNLRDKFVLNARMLRNQIL